MQIPGSLQTLIQKSVKVDPKPLQQLVKDFTADDGSGTTGLLDRSYFSPGLSMAHEMKGDANPFASEGPELRWAAQTMRRAMDHVRSAARQDGSASDIDPKPLIVRSPIRDLGSVESFVDLDWSRPGALPDFGYVVNNPGREQQFEIYNLRGQSGEPEYILFRERFQHKANNANLEYKVVLKADGSEAYLYKE